MHLQEDGGGQALRGRSLEGRFLCQKVDGGHEDVDQSFEERIRDRWERQKSKLLRF